VCLLVALFQVVPEVPLVVAANRDELYGRPAVSMTALRVAGPRILGGRDEVAGGTWLAVNEYGVVAGLTNQPSAAGRDATKRSRGELPLMLARQQSAAAAVKALADEADPAAWNPCWLLVGDRESLFSVGFTGRQVETRALEPGLHVLENVPLGTPSAKVDQVTELVGAARAAWPGDDEAALAQVLRSHQQAAPASGPAPARPGGQPRPPELSAACVHTERYGTRSALIVTVPAAGLPRLRVADGPPCQAPLLDVTDRWAA
jgi:uncharacterized protein with NRDE domain